MALEAREFGIALQKAGKDLTAVQFRNLVRKVALDALRGIVLKTPVDTGRARGNWQVTIGQPAAGKIDYADKGGGPTISKGTGEILAAPPIGKIWLTNNLPYAERLEHGWSQQAPAGMVQLTLVEIQSRLA